MKKKCSVLMLLFFIMLFFSCKSNKSEVNMVNKKSDTTSVAKSPNNLFQIKSDTSHKPVQTFSSPNPISNGARPK
jgi:PBP1b-binding outer membrane lipoprotein LpoB